MSCKSIVIDGLEYKPTTQSASPIRIVILQRGWVMIGRYERDGDNCKLHNAAVIRIWGTTRGLGELALNGPTTETKIDPTNGLVEFHRLTEIATIVAEESKWKNHLS